MTDETTPVTPPSTAARSRPRKIRRRNQGASLSGDANLESLGEVQNTGESTLNTNNEAIGSQDTPRSSPSLPSNVPNGRASPEVDKGPTPARSPPTSEGLMPIWRLEDKIKEIILKAAAENEGQKPGQAYIFGDPTANAGYFKLGKSGKPIKREKDHQKDCEPSFELLGCIPRALSVPWFSRLESLALAELTNMKYSFNCRCSTLHTEYFRGSIDEGLEILNRWSSWLQRDPYDEKLQLLPFWRDRLSLLGGGAFSHPRCPNNNCRPPADIAYSSCQACLRLRLKAWTEVTESDEFEYECRTRVGWVWLRELMYWTYSTQPLLGHCFLILVGGWENVKLLFKFLCAPTTHLLFILLSVLRLCFLSNVPSESTVYLVVCALACWRIKEGLADTPGDSQFTKAQKTPRVRGKKATREASKSPGPETPPEIVSIEETSPEEETPSKKRSLSVHKPIENLRILQGPENTIATCDMSEAPIAEHNTPEPFLTPDRATRTGRRSPSASAKRRKSDVR